MPIYTYICPRHGRFEELRNVKAFARKSKCPACGKRSPIGISQPGKHILDFASGWNAGAGRYFDSKRDRETWMRETNSARIR